MMLGCWINLLRVFYEKKYRFNVLGSCYIDRNLTRILG